VVDRYDTWLTDSISCKVDSDELMIPSGLIWRSTASDWQFAGRKYQFVCHVLNDLCITCPMAVVCRVVLSSSASTSATRSYSSCLSCWPSSQSKTSTAVKALRFVIQSTVIAGRHWHYSCCVACTESWNLPDPPFLNNVFPIFRFLQALHVTFY